MCSISGIMEVLAFQAELVKSKSDALVEAIERMNKALRHRGPDDNGISHLEFQIGRSQGIVSLGNTRLAVIDTTPAGHQPMSDPESGNWITYNGETYNFRELRREIGDEFGSWKSNTDTEVVLRAYRKWGVEAFHKLRGMFALAIWDARKSELILARDPFGIKPLYYCMKEDLGLLHFGFPGDSSANSRGESSLPSSANSLIFASEVRALLASGLVSRKLSCEGVASFLEYGSVQAPLTIIDGVYSLMPGQVLRVRANEVASFDVAGSTYRRDAENAESAHGNTKSRSEAVTQLRVALEESVRMHLVSDVPLGVFLSGGMDSSALVALMSLVSKEKPQTFSVVFDEEKFTEGPHSRRVAEKFHTNHCEVHLSEDRLLGMLPIAISSLDQPTMDGINTFVVSKAVKDAGLTVALSGLGGDELFAGYATFRRAAQMQSLTGLRKTLLRSVSGVGKIILNGSVRRKKFWQLALSDGGPVAVYSITRQLFPQEEIARLIAGFGFGVATGLIVFASKAGDSHGANDVVNEISRLELQGYMANTLLRDTDSMSMAHSLEVRVPFVDTAVASYVLPLPGEWKVNGENGKLPKPLLADALRDLLPRDLLMRPKMGFTLPFEKWMQSTLRADISAVFEDRKQMSSANLNSAFVADVWQHFLRSPQSVGWSRPWALYVLAKWCACNAVTI
jgi:asparagine synthase (glutamine-hydrolysing)